VIGPTFKVVSCDCPSNKCFKSIEEWCEFCRCQNCGGKNHIIPASGENSSIAINLDLLLWLCFAVLFGYVLVVGGDQLYFGYYAGGALACLSTLRQLFSTNSISLKL
jgi:hypothetical protein